jgi:hypothetical protein
MGGEAATSLETDAAFEWLDRAYAARDIILSSSCISGRLIPGLLEPA